MVSVQKNGVDHTKETALKVQRAGRAQNSLNVFRKAPFTGPETSNLPVLQRAVANPKKINSQGILALQRSVGNRAVAGLIQAKLTVGAAGDRYEQEADRVADQVINKPAQAVESAGVQRSDEEQVQEKPLADSISRLIQRESAPEEEETMLPVQREGEEEETEEIMLPVIQRQDIPEEQNQEVRLTPLLQRSGDGGFEVGGEVEQQLQSTRGGGNPLPADVRSFMEPRFGADFSSVRVHSDSSSGDLSHSLKAQAFTQGSDIYMGQGKYDPGSSEGKHLLAHELTHVVQQGAAGAPPQAQKLEDVQRKPDGNDSAIQREDGGAAITADQINMRKVISGSLEGGKKVSDYYPDLADTKSWGGDTAAGPFDNKTRAGSVVQLIGEIPAGAKPADFTFKQMITITAIKLDGKPHALEGQTLDDIAHSGQNQATVPFRQTWDNKVTMCDPISGVPYNKLKTYDFAASAITSIVHKSGVTKSVNWSVKVKTNNGKVIENTVS